MQFQISAGDKKLISLKMESSMSETCCKKFSLMNIPQHCLNSVVVEPASVYTGNVVISQSSLTELMASHDLLRSTVTNQITFDQRDSKKNHCTIEKKCCVASASSHVAHVGVAYVNL